MGVELGKAILYVFRRRREGPEREQVSAEIYLSLRDFLARTAIFGKIARQKLQCTPWCTLGHVNRIE
jgi:hypothetical protein